MCLETVSSRCLITSETFMFFNYLKNIPQQLQSIVYCVKNVKHMIDLKGESKGCHLKPWDVCMSDVGLYHHSLFLLTSFLNFA